MKETRFCGIPYDENKEDINTLKVIDSLLHAGTCGVSKALFEDGDYDIFDNGDNTYTLIIVPTPTYSIFGIIDHKLFLSTKTITFDKLQKGRMYYLYIQSSNELFAQPEKFNKIVSTTKRLETPEKMLIATVNLIKEPYINENPLDKVYSKDILAHTHDSSNPHGRKLYQDNLYINDDFYINNQKQPQTIYVSGNENKIFTFDKDVLFVNKIGDIKFVIKDKQVIVSEVKEEYKLEIKV